MIAIIKKWLHRRLGLLIDIEKLGHTMKDGTMLVRILKHYDAINTVSIDIQPSQDDFICRINLIQLKVWFKLLSIDFSREIIENILSGKIISCVDILYQLYLCFEINNSYYFVPKQRERFIRNHNKKFKVTEFSLSDIKQKTPNYENRNLYHYSDRILEHNDAIKWYENKYCKKKSCDVKSPFLVPINDKGNKKSTKGAKCLSKKKTRYEEDVCYVRNELDKCRGLNNTCGYESLCDNDFIYYSNEISGSNSRTAKKCKTGCDIHNRGHFLPPISTKSKQKTLSVCTDISYSVENYLTKLQCVVKSSFKKRRKSKVVCDSIYKDAWDMILDIEEQEFRKIIAGRLLKQSLFERKLSMKFFQLMKQSEAQKQSYVKLEKRLKNKQPLDCKKDYGLDNDFCITNEEDKSVMYHDLILYYEDERKRTVELHRRLYAEKLKLRFQKHYALCLQTIEDIVDIAIKQSEFKSHYENKVPDRLFAQIVCLFHHGIPIFDVDNIGLGENNEFKVTDIVKLSRQTVLNEWDLNNYLDIRLEWDNLFEHDLSNLFLNNVCTNPDNQHVLGYVVHRLLESKYPCQLPPKPADIPKYPLRVILNTMCDEEVTMKLTSLLKKAEILVIDVNSAVTFCLQCYKNEIGCKNIEVPDRNDLKSGSGRLEKNRTPCISEDLLADSRKGDTVAFKDKDTQTSVLSFYDINDAFPLGEAAKLGGELLRNMLLGNEMPTNLIVDVIIEFIKSYRGKIKGWVLVNFPSTLFQASVLEYALTSKKFPYHLDDDADSVFDSDGVPSFKDFKDDDSSNFEVEVRSSRIVPNPRECGREDVFKTYFSKYITTIKGETMSYSSCDNFTVAEECESLNLLTDSTLLLEHPEREGVPVINDFYREQGISYDFIYEVFDLSALKQLARLIVYHSADDSIRTSVELFGEEVLDSLAESNVLRNNDMAGHGKSEVTQTRAVKNTSVCDDDISLPLENVVLKTPESIHRHSDQTSRKDTSPKPGDRNWVYSSASLPDYVPVVLASFWESLETVYLNNLRDVFFLKRNTDYSLIPYVHYVTKSMETCFNQKDDRQGIVTLFLNYYNEIHQVLRSDEEMKNELHLRVIELKDELVKLCENKRDFTERIRRTLIDQNWTYLHMVVVGNCFISMIQIEADRCMRTLDFLKDYYLAMLGLFKPEPLVVNDINLSKINLVVVEESRESVIASEIIDRMLDYDHNSTLLDNPVYSFIENKTSEVLSEFIKTKTVVDNLITAEETNALKVQKDLLFKKELELNELEKKMKQSTDRKKLKGLSEVENIQEQLLQATNDLREDAMQKELDLKNLFVEWSHAVNDEVDRALFRIEMIKRKAFLELKAIENIMACTFNYFYDAEMLTFNKECDCVDQLCLLFELAIEEKTPINADVNLVKNNLYVSKRVIVKPETFVKLPTPLEEMFFEESFTIKQLEEIKERLMYIAPNGFISQEALVNLIQGLIIQGRHGSIKLVPNLWDKLKPDELGLFFHKVFGNAGIIEWRDFLIYCLELPYPVTEDLIDARLQFLRYDPHETETVSYQNYMSTTLWFHRELPETPLQALRNILAKEYLFTLYKISDENFINYTSLLMAFCKDEDVRVGFGKGLSLLYGRCVIMFEEDLFLEKILTDHIDSSVKIVHQILEHLMEDVVETSFGIMKRHASQFRYREYSVLDFDLTAVGSSKRKSRDHQLTESMYDQFFRRHVTLQWTSKVPYVVIVTLISIAFYPSFMSLYVFHSYSHMFEEIRSHMTALQELGEAYAYMPSFLEDWCLEKILQSVHKFRALSFTNIVKDITLARD